MKFGPVAVADAEGTVLAHALQLQGRRLKKGHVLTDADLSVIAEEQIAQLIVARLEENDISENEAATMLADRLCGQGMYAEKAFTGRVNLYAANPGLFDVQRTSVDALNSIDPAITFATLGEGELVEQGRMVATVKIIPFAVRESSLRQCCSLAEDEKTVSVREARPLRVALIQTQLPTVKASALDKTSRNLKRRLEPSGSSIVDEIRIGHSLEGMMTALERVGREPDLIVIFGASAITDRADIIPAALEQAGGSVSYLGMPVDPGNLLMIGRLGKRNVIGAPGCARSPVENGFDWVLQRYIHGAHVDGGYISRLGVGGLLMEITDRPQPREGGADE